MHSLKITLSCNKLSSSDVSLEKVETLIDDAIGEVNLRAGTSIEAMSGSAGSKTAEGIIYARYTWHPETKPNPFTARTMTDYAEDEDELWRASFEEEQA